MEQQERKARSGPQEEWKVDSVPTDNPKEASPNFDINPL
jgi:hypothetical protein